MLEKIKAEVYPAMTTFDVAAAVVAFPATFLTIIVLLFRAAIALYAELFSRQCDSSER